VIELTILEHEHDDVPEEQLGHDPLLVDVKTDSHAKYGTIRFAHNPKIHSSRHTL